MQALRNGVTELKGMLLPQAEEVMIPGRRERITNIALTALAVLGAAMLAVTLFEPILIVLAIPAAILLGVTMLTASAFSGGRHPRGSWGNLLGRFGGGVPRANGYRSNGWGAVFGGDRGPQRRNWMSIGNNPGRGWGERQFLGSDSRRR